MNNKDLFNAVNDIDEKFITDAGKYLRNDSFFQNDESIEFAPKERKRLPIKIAAPAAAAVVLTVGVTIALRTRGKDRSHQGNESAWAYISNGSAESDPIDSDVIMPSGELPFSLLGPDGKRIRYEEITGVAHNITLQQLNATNWISITCSGFAFIAEPTGENLNSAANPEMFPISDESATELETQLRRIYVGERFGGLTVKNASCEFRRTPTNGITEAQIKNDSIRTSRLFQYSYVEFSGETDLTGYIVKDDTGDYWFVPGEGETRLPSMSFTTKIRDFEAYKVEQNIGEFDYMGDLPKISVSDSLKTKLNAYFEDTNVQRANVHLSDISICYDAQETQRFRVNADTTDVAIMNWSEEQSGSSLEAAYVINSSATVGELFSKSDEITAVDNEFDHFKVFFDTPNGSANVQITDESQNLVVGMRICMFDRENRLRGTYYYNQSL